LYVLFWYIFINISLEFVLIYSWFQVHNSTNHILHLF
jgi:hypothetical protein